MLWSLPAPLYVALYVLATGIAFLLAFVVHELGHALVALNRTDADVKLVVESRRRRGRAFRLGRLHVRIGLGAGGFCEYEPPLTRLDLLLIAAGGPAASLLAGAAVAFGTAFYGLPLVPGWTFAALCLVEGAGNLWPFMYRSDEAGPRPSDGLVIAYQLGWRAEDDADASAVAPDASV
jgi:hypothetical protein